MNLTHCSQSYNEIKFNLKATKFCCIGSYDKQNLKLVILYECQILGLVINLRVSLPHYSDRKNNVINSATFNMHDLGAFGINQ